MINKESPIRMSPEERKAALEYRFGQWGADKSMPHAYKESNWHVFPETCDCLVLDANCANMIYSHLAKHYPSTVAKMRTPDPVMLAAFQKNYVERYGMDFVRDPSQRDLYLGNFALMKVKTCLPREYLLIYPDMAHGHSLEHALQGMERYLISHGHYPDRTSPYTATAVEQVVNRTLFITKENRFDYDEERLRLKTRDDSVFVGLEASDNGKVNILTQKPGENPPRTTKRPLNSINTAEMQRLMPAIKAFCKKYTSALPKMTANSLHLEKQIANTMKPLFKL